MTEETAPVYLDRLNRPQQADGVFIVGSAADDVQAVAVIHDDGVSLAGASEIMPADPDRYALTVRNASDTQMRLRVDGVESGPTDYPLDAGRGYEFPSNMVPSGAISIYCVLPAKAWNVMYATRAV